LKNRKASRQEKVGHLERLERGRRWWQGFCDPSKRLGRKSEDEDEAKDSETQVDML
jgi:hypothetical protein